MTASTTIAASSDRIWLPAWTLCQRELVRFFRQRDRIASAFATPLLFWLVIGSGMGRSFLSPSWFGGTGYLQYLFPGSIAMVLLFTAIFSTISVIEDRREGFLQSVLVAPVAPAGIVIGKLAGGAMIATLQAVLFLLVGPMAGIPLGVGHVVATAIVAFLVAFGLTGLGFLLAWRLDSVQGFHAVMNLLLMPMWMLSGALFPASGAAGWLRVVMRCNPLTYGVGALQHAMGLGEMTGDGALSFWMALGVTALFAGLMLWAAVAIVRRPRQRYEA